MRRASLADAKAQLSRLVDDAEHHGKRTVILRHGKPTAAIVPVDVAMPPKPRSRSIMDAAAAARSVKRFIREFSAADPGTSAVEDLLQGRR